MNREDIIGRFRADNPEITSNVASDAVLKSWLITGNMEVAIKARLIMGDTTFSSIINITQYDLTSEIPNFYDIDELPGDGVIYDGRRLTLKSLAQISNDRPTWRSQSSGVPRDYYRRGPYLNLGREPSAAEDIIVYTILVPDDFDDDVKTPFNELTYLEPFHYALVLYLKMRAFAGKVKKPKSAGSATEEYENYINWIKKEVNRGIYKNIQMRPTAGYRGVSRTNR